MLCDFSVLYHLLIVFFSLEDPGEVHGSLSVLLDSALCAIAPILFLTTQVPEMDDCSQKTQVLTALYYIASNSQAKWNTLIDWFSVWILQYGPLPWKRPVSIFLLSPWKFKLSETQKVFKKRNLFFHHKSTILARRI